MHWCVHCLHASMSSWLAGSEGLFPPRKRQNSASALDRFFAPPGSTSRGPANVALCSPQRPLLPLVLGASMGYPTHGKGHEERGLTKRKGEIRPRGKPPGLSQTSAPQTTVCLPYCIMLSPTLLTLTGGCPPTTFLWKELT